VAVTKKKAKKVAKKATKKKVSRKKVAKKATKKKVSSKKVAKKATKKKVSSKRVAKKATKKKAPKKASTGESSQRKSTDRQNKTRLSKPKLVSVPVADLEFTPLDSRVLVKKEGVSDRTPGGIFIPGTVDQEKPNRGTIISVGRGQMDKKGRVKPMDVKKGDQIIYSAYSGENIEFNGQEVLLLREEDILGIIS